MDSSWTKVRQLVANRVLTRHLEDIHDQRIVVEMAHQQHVRQVERDLRQPPVQRPRAASIQVSSSAQAVPTSRRRSLPVSSRQTGSNSSTPRHQMGKRTDLAKDLASKKSDEKSSSKIFYDKNVDPKMANAFVGPRNTAKQRPSLTGSPQAPAMTSAAQTNTNSKSFTPRISKANSRSKISSDSPQLEKGETFIKNKHSQVLSLSGNQYPDSMSASTIKTDHQEKDKTMNGLESSKENTTAAPPFHHDSDVVYDEETGLKKDDGGFTPKSELSLPLDVLTEENEVDNDSVDNSINQPVVDDNTEEEEELEEFLGDENDPWSEVKKCHYLRGYDPPTMRMPKDSVKFVFGEKS